MRERRMGLDFREEGAELRGGGGIAATFERGQQTGAVGGAGRQKIKAERAQPMTVVATGGVASLFEGATDCIDHFDSDLTIRGLLEIHRRNTTLET